MNDKKVQALYEGWEETMIWSCLQGCMGTLIVDDEENPSSAVIDIGDFCFFAGEPDTELLKAVDGFKLLIPKDGGWEKLIEAHFQKRAEKIVRYAIQKEPGVFDTGKLESYVKNLLDGYELRMIDQELFEAARKEEWSADLCSQFQDYADYEKRGIGAGILHEGVLVAGASPYTVYRGGIEIEIDTKPEYRRRGLATVCGSKLILECLKRNLYPSWDAHDLRSVALAEKLGYHLSHPYTAYELVGE